MTVLGFAVLADSSNPSGAAVALFGVVLVLFLGGGSVAMYYYDRRAKANGSGSYRVGAMKTVTVMDTTFSRTRSDRKVAAAIARANRDGYELVSMSDNRKGTSGRLCATLIFRRVR